MLQMVKQPTSDERADLREYRYGTCIVRTWCRTDGNWSIAPWLFSVQQDGEAEHHYTGVPNYCESRQKARMRGWWRAKWLMAGTYSDHYRPVPPAPLPGAYKIERFQPEAFGVGAG